MRFRAYWSSLKDNKDEIFETVFDKYYQKGYFGKIEKRLIKEQQKSWFEKFIFIIECKDKESLLMCLQSRDSLCTREWFSRIYSVDITEKSMNEINLIVDRCLL